MHRPTPKVTALTDQSPRQTNIQNGLQEVLLIENDINTAPFTPAVYDCVPTQPWSVAPADLADANRWG